MTVDSLTSDSTSARRAAQTKRILFALNERQRKAFFPGELPQWIADTECLSLDPTMLSYDEWTDLLRKTAPTILVSCWATPPLPVTLFDDPTFPLNYVCHLAGSVRKLLPRELLVRGLLVSNWGDSISNSVAEHALLLVFASLRNLPRWITKSEAATLWSNKSALKTLSLKGRSVGIHGFGSIARKLVNYLKPFQCKIFAYSKQVPKELFLSHGVIPCGSIEELFCSSEVLVECEALTDETRGCVTEHLLRCLPEDATFINVGRGAVVDEFALARVATEKSLRVACDVLASEPLSPESPLWDLPNVLISPHIAGPTSELFPHLGNLAIENIHRYLHNRVVKERVSLEIYDRST